MGGQRLDRRVERPGDGEAERRGVLAVGDDARHAGDALERGRRHRPREHHLDLAHRAAHELGDVLDGDELTLAHEGHAVAHALHLRQHVGAEEDGLTGLAGLVQQAVELVLDERVEAGGGLVEDQQFRPVHERLDEADLTPVPGAEVGHLALEVAVQALGELGGVVPVHAAAQVGEVAQRLAPGEAGVQAQLTGQVAAARLDRQRLARGCPGRARGRARTSAGSGPAARGWWWSCRPRWGRGSRTPRPAAPRGPGRRRRARGCGRSSW